MQVYNFVMDNSKEDIGPALKRLKREENKIILGKQKTQKTLHVVLFSKRGTSML